MTDWELLRRYKDEHSEAAFAKIVERYLEMVYAVCYRRLGNRELAEDCAQAVFVILARKSEFRRGNTLSSWLFQTATYVAKHAVRSEMRWSRLRKRVEVESSTRTGVDAATVDARVVLDDAVRVLATAEREAVLLRYYRDLTFVELGDVLGITEEAARKRVDRGVQKLRRFLAQPETGAEQPTALTALLAGSPAPMLGTHAHEVLVLHIARAAGSIGAHAKIVTVAASVQQLTMEVLKRMLVTQLKAAAICAVGLAVVSGGTIYAVSRAHATGESNTATSTVAPAQVVDPAALRMGADLKRQNGLQLESLRRLKTLALATMMYAEDHIEYFPDLSSTQAMKAALMPYLVSILHGQNPRLMPVQLNANAAALFQQPGTNSPYVANKSLSKVGLAAIEAPAYAVLFYEAHSTADMMTMKDHRNAAFADGHAKACLSVDWDRLKTLDSHNSHLPASGK